VKETSQGRVFPDPRKVRSGNIFILWKGADENESTVRRIQRILSYNRHARYVTNQFKIRPMADPEPPIPNHREFLNMAFWFEGSMIGVAWLIGWFVNVDPFSNFSVDGTALFFGIVGTLPLILLFLLFYRYPVGPLHPIKNSLLEILGPVLSRCGWHELVILAVVAGVSEEILFRGLLQPWLEGIAGPPGGLILSNVIFGLLHWLTPMYALIAGLIGFYLAFMMDITGSRQLLTPIVIHSLYDFLAFVVVAEAYRLQKASA
jgi:uncharacterized protein